MLLTFCDRNFNHLNNVPKIVSLSVVFVELTRDDAVNVMR